MKLKLDESGGVALSDGKPVYVDDNGKEHVYDAPAMRQSLDKLGKELQTQRTTAEKLAEDAKAFEGLDVAAARKALETVGNLDQSKLIAADKVEEIKAAAIKSVEDKYKPIEERAAALEQELFSEKVGGQFSRSKFIADKLAPSVTPYLAQSGFGKYFEIKDGKVLAKDANGNLIYSDANPGEAAGFDEALEKLVLAHPDRDKLLRGANHNGSGAGGVEGATGRVVTRAQFREMAPAMQQKTAAAVREGTAQLVD